MAEELIKVAEEISVEPDIKEIPIDKPISDFYNHMTYNERIIFQNDTLKASHINL